MSNVGFVGKGTFRSIDEIQRILEVITRRSLSSNFPTEDAIELLDLLTIRDCLEELLLYRCKTKG